MAQIVGSIPEFTSDEGNVPNEEVLQVPPVETPAPEETPTEPPAAPSGEAAPAPSQEEKAVQALELKIVELRKDITDLRGTRRELKQAQIQEAQKQIDDLKDVNPADVALIDRVLKNKGYMTQEEIDRTYRESVTNEEVGKFLEKYPEYKAENDPSDLNWKQLEAEMLLFKTPKDPRQIALLLEKAHRTVHKVAPAAPIAAKKRALEIASHGSGGTQRSTPPSKSIDPAKLSMLHGFTDEDIKNIQARL